MYIRKVKNIDLTPLTFLTPARGVFLLTLDCTSDSITTEKRVKSQELIAMQEIEKKVSQYFKGSPGIIAVYIFGSFAKEKINQFSDIDIAVLVADELKESSYTDLRLKFMTDLSSVLEKETDVVILNQAPPFLKYQIFKYGKATFERDDRRSRSFKARSILEYFDFKPIKDFVEGVKIKRLKETSHG